ncbi:hypothetical protein CEXT_417041 [Caerostris extrusa]|uniref:Uncharacterized protein n=1 Tax=Caerostris extrusa TaxID=172846 RepID=A0AAV4T852_CAEEX|nr:hypothetical protein CEXT_417041 [Caerostris extrusa]
MNNHIEVACVLAHGELFDPVRICAFKHWILIQLGEKELREGLPSDHGMGEGGRGLHRIDAQGPMHKHRWRNAHGTCGSS